MDPESIMQLAALAQESFNRGDYAEAVNNYCKAGEQYEEVKFYDAASSWGYC
ncbi:hypothetical protein ACFL6S_08015 [Candidatus Poribacteria bacterium]